MPVIREIAPMKNVFKRRINLKSFWDSAKAILVYRDYQYRLAIFTESFVIFRKICFYCMWN